MLGVILVRGMIHTRPDVRETLKRLGAVRKNALVLVEDTPSTRGMLRKVEAYVTYGELPDDFIERLVNEYAEPCREFTPRFPGLRAKRARCKEIAGRKIKPLIRLQPPRGGWGRKGVKVLFKQGGALGERESDAMVALVERMLPEKKRVQA